MPEFETILYDVPRPGVARVTLNRPEKANAQTPDMLYEINDAFDIAVRDDAIKVIILAAAGAHFSAGHDIKTRRGPGLDPEKTVGTWGGYTMPGAEGPMAVEEEIFLGFCMRWRDISKPTIAQVQGMVVGGGQMLVWPCDLIIASDDAGFRDPTPTVGVNGSEYFMHPWEYGPRKAKELLFTSDVLPAHEAKILGMVNQVVPRAELESYTLALAEKIATKPTFALKLAKQSVNMALEAMGQTAALQAAFGLHTLAHSHNRERFGYGMDPSGIPSNLRREGTPLPDGPETPPSTLRHA